MAGATFSRVKVWVKEKLMVADLNAEFNNILNNLMPTGIDDQSSNLAAMQTVVDPYPASVASLATSLAGELQRLRYMIKQITGESYWYLDPAITLDAINEVILQGQWIAQSSTPPTFVSGTTFTMATDLTGTYTQGKRVRANVTAGYVYGTVKSSAFTDKTTVVVDWDSGSLDDGLSLISIGIITNPSSIAIAPVVNKTAAYTLAKTDLNQRIEVQAASDQECTISKANPCVVAKTGHGLSAGDRISFETTGELPSGVSANTTYYVLAAGLGTDDFRISLTAGGTAIATTTDGSGTHTYNREITISLPAATTIPSGAWYLIKNIGKGKVTIDGTIDGFTNPQIGQYDSIQIRSNQAVWQDDNPKGVPVGSIFPMATSAVPLGYLECNGASVSRTTYARLFRVLGVTYGSADGTTFKLPDYRGQFLRGWANGQTTDPDKATRTDRGDGNGGDIVGSKQASQVIAHTHGARGSATQPTTAPYGTGGGAGSAALANALNDRTGYYTVDTSHEHESVGGNENRPTNINVMYVIKY